MLKMYYIDSFGVEHIPKEITRFIEIEILQRIFIKYKRTIHECVDTFVLSLLILC